MGRKRCLTAAAAAILLALAVAGARAAEITGLDVYSEDEYVRVALTLDEPVTPSVETRAGEHLVFLRFENTGMGRLEKQSYLYDNNPHLGSLTFLPIGPQSTVARLEARHPFRVRTYETSSPSRFIIELAELDDSGMKDASSLSRDHTYHARGLEQMQKGNFKSALMNFRSAIRAGNRVADSYYQAGLIRYRLGENEKARINFERACGSSSHGDDARLYLCWLAHTDGDNTRLVRDWQNFLLNMPDPQERLALAASHPEIDYRVLRQSMESGDSGTGEQEQRGEVSELAAMSFARGMAARERGDLQEAARHLEQAVEQDPSYSEAHFQLGVVYKAMGRNSKSADHFEKSLDSSRMTEGETLPGAAGNSEPEQSAEYDNGVSSPLPSGSREEAVVREQTPAEDNGASDNKTLNLTPPPELAQDEAPDEGGDKDKSSVATSAVQDDSGDGPRGGAAVLATLKEVAARYVDLERAALLRHRVELLAMGMGVLFLLTLLGERIALRLGGSSEKSTVPGPLAVKDLISGGAKSPNGGGSNGGGGAIREPALAMGGATVARKREMEAVLARELAAKRSEAEEAGQEQMQEEKAGMDLDPVARGGMYGADIAGRIKEHLSRESAVQSSPRRSAGADNDIQVRLIRQLRSRDWTISDIAQEMSLSREEVKWALAASRGDGNGNGNGRKTAVNGGSAPVGDDSYGAQLRGLVSRKKNGAYDRDVKGSEIDREVDLELEINV